MVNLFFVPSLKYVTLNKIAIILCGRTEILFSIPVNLNPKEVDKTFYLMRDWLKENELLIEKLVQLLQIHNLSKQIRETCSMIAYQICYWKSSNHAYKLFYEYVLENYESLQWTPNGEIDYPGTARNVVGDTSLNLHQRYCISCVHSFEDEISKLESLLVSDVIHVFRYGTETDLAILLYWRYNCHLNLGLTFLDMFKVAVKGKNIPSMKYFYGKLTLAEKGAIFSVVQQVIRKANRIEFRQTPTSFLLCLLSFLPEADSVSALRKYAFHILLFFMNSPLRVYYREVLERVFPHLSVREIYLLFLHLTTKNSIDLFSYEDILEEAWLMCPRAMKRNLLEITMKTDLLLKVMKVTGKVRSLKLLLSFATKAQRFKIRVQMRRCFWNLREATAFEKALIHLVH